jgi:aspartate racemase
MKCKRVGIVGGVGPSATILYYQQISELGHKRMEGDHYPEILIHSLDMGEVTDFFYRNDMDALTEKLVRAVGGLHQGGCDMAIISCNAMHMVFDRVRQRVGIPMVSILDAVMMEVRKRHLRTVGIMGTIFIMQSDLYRAAIEKAGIACIEPGPEEQAWIMKAILEDLQRPSIPKTTIDRFAEDIQTLRKMGAEAVILACTDLPVAIRAENSPIPILDTTRIHVDATLDFAFAET